MVYWVKTSELFPYQSKYKMDLFTELQEKRIFETQEYFTSQKKMTTDALLLLTSFQKNIGQQISKFQNYLKILDEKSTILMNTLKEDEDLIQKEFKKSKNLNEKQTEESLKKLSTDLTKTLDFGQRYDFTVSNNISKIMEEFMDAKVTLENQKNSQSKVKNSTFNSLCNCIQKMKIKQSMGEFNHLSSFSVTSLFELIFDFLPQDAQTFLSLRQTSKEIASIAFERWSCISNSLPFKVYLNCKNITKVSLEIGIAPKFQNYETYLSDYFNSFKIKHCTLLLYTEMEDQDDLFHFLVKQSLESLTLVSATDIYLNDLGSLFDSGIKTLKLAVSSIHGNDDTSDEDIIEEQEMDLEFAKEKFKNSKLENLILLQCSGFSPEYVDISKLKKLYTDVPMKVNKPFQFHCVNGKDFSSVEAVKDFRREAQNILEDYQRIKINEPSTKFFWRNEINSQQMQKYFQELKLLTNDQIQFKKKKIE
jgi:hypothetical protein